MNQIHPTQLEILKKLLFATTLRYTEMKPHKDMENNQFSFHLDKLIDQNLISKDKKRYTLTAKGKEFANRMDTDEVQIKKQAKISVLCGCVKKINNEFEFLIFTRKKQPFYNHQGFPSGKVRFGESIIAAATRELNEETSLIGIAEIVTIRHYLVHDKNTDELLEDKFMFLCRFKNPSGEILQSEEGLYEWVKESELQTYITKPFDTLDEMLSLIKILKSTGQNIDFEEQKHITESF